MKCARSRWAKLFLCCALLLSLMTVTAFAEDLTPITGVSFKGISVPVVGETIQDISGASIVENTSGSNKYRVIDNQTCSWKDEEGRLIEYGLQVFEAGRTYSISFNVDAKDGFAFTSEDIPVELYNLYAHQYEGSITLSQESSVAQVTFTFALGGYRTYDDISDFRFYGMRAPEDGDTVSNSNGTWAYNNSEMTNRYWTDSNGNRLEVGTGFVSGNAYYFNYEFTAFSGYKFADNIFVRANNEEPTNWEYTFDNERTMLHIKIPYFIATAETVGSVVVDGMFIPEQSESTRDWDSNVYLRVPGNSNYNVPNQTLGWYEVDAEYSVDTQYKVTEQKFLAGKQYKMFLILHANDGFKFAPPESISFEFSGIPASHYTYACREGGSDSNITVVITFTAQFAAGTGTIENPVVCSTFEEMKYALEHPTVKGIVVNSFTNNPNQDFYTLQKEKDFKAGHCAITVPDGTTKYLTINADIDIRVPYMDYLLYSFIDIRGSLTVGGTGTLGVSMNARGYPSAILFNNGTLEVGGSVTLDPSNKSFDSMHGYSVINASGKTVIYSGTFSGYATSAVLYQGGSMEIHGGTFKVENGNDQAFGLNTDTYLSVAEHDVALYGGTFDGIRADQSTGLNVVKLPDLLGYGAYYVQSSGDEFNTTGLKDTHEKITVKMNNIVSEVEVTIGRPTKGSTPDQLIHTMTPGYQKSVEYGIQWQESTDGSTWRDIATNETFAVGKYHRVFINLKVSDGYMFAYDSQWEPVVSGTVNGKYAEVFRYPEENPDELIFLRYNFGMLNDIYINQIRINDIVEPKAGQKPSYTCTIGGNGYTINNANNNGTYVFNGICWKDVSDPNWEEFMGPNDTFVLGGVYTVIIDVKTLDDYEFSTNTIGGSYEATGTGWVNGEKADLGISMNDTLNKEQNVQYTFTCGAQEISTIILYNLDEPVGGKVPDTTVTAAYSEYYTVESVTWNDIEGGAVGATFETGMSYQATIVVKAKPDVYFTADPTVYIDGNQPNSNKITVNGDTVTVVYTFSKPAAAPEVEQNPILQWNGSACTIYPNSSGATMAASYVNGQLKEVVFFKNNTSVTLSGDSVKVFFLKTDTYAPVRNAIEE